MAGTRRPIIEVKNLRKEYPVLDETVVALERINLTIPQGQICCIYGESGSGKSTLLNQLAGMEKPTKGGVRIGGVRMNHYPTQMSGGQQQRVGIARAFAARPQVVFADEPTGNLDSKTKTDVMNMICAFARDLDQTIVLVTHDDNMAQYADRIVTLLDGRIIDDRLMNNA